MRGLFIFQIATRILIPKHPIILAHIFSRRIERCAEIAFSAYHNAENYYQQTYKKSDLSLKYEFPNVYADHEEISTYE